MDEENLKTVKINLQGDPSICVVDDDNFVVDLIGRTLNLSGYKNAKFYNSGEKFIENAVNNSQNFSIVISDIVLPGMSGFELCARVKQVNPDIPVILISGFDIEDIHSKVIECGADDFIAKPFNPLELITRLKIHLAKYEKVSNSSIQKPEFSKKTNMPFIGDQVGDYVIVDTIGWGRSSFIFKANKKGIKQVFALKMLAPHVISLKDLVERFENELKMMSSIKHPNIVNFIDKGRYGEIPYVVMEYINGLDLEELLITRGKIPVNDALAISYGIASAIAELHKQKILHRDIKLKNVIFDVNQKAPKLIDFGIAREIEAVHITRDGFVLGTPIYMPPEMFEGEEATIKSDIYSFGATIFHLLTGSPPFVGESSKELYKKHLYEKPRPIKDFRPDIPEVIERLIIEECLAKEPDKRPESMEYVEEKFRNYIKKL